MDDLIRLDATAQAALVRNGDVAAVELVDAAIARIERLDSQLNAVILRRFERVREEARTGLPDGPFRGVPFLLKDTLCQIEGEPHHVGMRVLKEAGYRSDHDSYLGARYKRAGFAILGKTNLPELALSPITDSVAYGPARNPWDLERTTGGSSGGAGAAVAAGFVPVAHGSDAGGSIRIPASACGVVGLLPSRGRTTLGPDFASASARKRASTSSPARCATRRRCWTRAPVPRRAIRTARRRRCGRGATRSGPIPVASASASARFGRTSGGGIPPAPQRSSPPSDCCRISGTRWRTTTRLVSTVSLIAR